MVADFPLKPVISLDASSRPRLQCQECLLTCGSQIQSERGWLSPQHYIKEYMFPCQSLLQLKGLATVYDLPSPAACTASSGTVKANHQGGSCRFSSSFVYPCPMTKMCGVFNNSFSPYSFDGKPKLMIINFIVLETSGDILTNNL